MNGTEKWEMQEKILPNIASRPAGPTLSSQFNKSILSTAQSSAQSMHSGINTGYSISNSTSNGMGEYSPERLLLPISEIATTRFGNSNANSNNSTYNTYNSSNTNNSNNTGGYDNNTTDNSGSDNYIGGRKRGSSGSFSSVNSTGNYKNNAEVSPTAKLVSANAYTPSWMAESDV